MFDRIIATSTQASIVLKVPVMEAGIHNCNRALLIPTADEKEKLAQFRHLQAAAFEMNTACAYF